MTSLVASADKGSIVHRHRGCNQSHRIDITICLRKVVIPEESLEGERRCGYMAVYSECLGSIRGTSQPAREPTFDSVQKVLYWKSAGRVLN